MCTWTLLLPLVLLVSLVLSDTSPFDGQSFGFCLFWWSDIGDDGYTDAHQDGYVAALSRLEAKYPNVTFSTRRVVNVAFTADKLAAYNNVASLHLCHIVFFAYSDLYVNISWLIGEAENHPERLFLVGDLRVYDKDWPRNIVAAEPICDREWYLAGAIAGRMFSNLSLTMTVSFEDQGTAYASHALAAGIRYAQGNATEISKPRIVPMNSWVAETNEEIVGTLAVSKNGDQVLTHFSDPYVVSSVAHDSDRYSIGWGHDYANFYLASLLTSVIRVYDEVIFDIAEDWMFNVSTPRMVVGCLLTPMSSAVPSSVKSFIEALNATLNTSADIWSDAMYFNTTGYPTLAGPLNPFDVASLNFTTNFSLLNPVFLGSSICVDNTEASHNATPDFLTVCTACPTGSFARNGNPCAVCVGTDEPLCPQHVLEQATSKTVLAATLGVGIPLVVAAIVTIAFLLRRSSRLTTKMKGTRNDPSSVRSSEGAKVAPESSLFSHDDNKAEAIRDSIQRSEYCLGAGVPNAALGATVYKCFQNDGGTLSVYEFNRRTSEEVQLLDSVLFHVTAHPNIVRVYCVLWREETSSAQLFCESSSGGSLTDMLSETKGRLQEQSARMFAGQILRAIAHLHALRCCHRTILPSYVLLSSSGTPRIFCGPQTSCIDPDSDASLTVVGDCSIFHCPPEVLTGRFDASDPFANSAWIDMWMYGVLVAQLMNSGGTPWPVDAAKPGALAHYLTQEGGQPVISSTAISGLGKDFVAGCTSPTPSKRPLAAQHLLHPWLSLSKTASGGSGGGMGGRGAAAVDVSNIPSPMGVPPPPGVRVGKLIGMGSFGSVHLVTLESGAIAAMKSVTIDLADPAAETRVRRAKREFDVLSQISHPNIIRYVGFDFDGAAALGTSTSSGPIKNGSTLGSNGGSSAAFSRSVTSSSMGNSSICQMRIFMEYIADGNLKQFMVCHPEVVISPPDVHGHALQARTPSMLLSIVKSMVCAVEASHLHGVIHRDVKPSNFLFCGPPAYVKLADFGSAAMIEGASTSSVTMQGTLLYMAPEILREEVPTTAADIWSLGATVMELVTRQSPWAHVFGPGSPVMAVVAYIASNEPLRLPPHLDEKVVDFLEKCLVREPNRRASAKQLLSHEWIAAL